MRLKTGFVIREIAGEKMILMRAGNTTDMTKAVMLNASSEFLWNSLQDRVFDENDVKELLTGRYNVEPERAMVDTQSWISSMINAGLIDN
ncbi:MAG: PqqD family protein [Bacteroidales bacterium]